MKSIILFLLIVLLSIGIIINTPTVFAQQTSLDLTAPTITDLYGGDKKGTLDLTVQNNTIFATSK
jgi:hypothetical protein